MNATTISKLTLEMKRLARLEAGAGRNTPIFGLATDRGEKPVHCKGHGRSKVTITQSWLVARFGVCTTYDWAVNPVMVARVLGGSFRDGTPAGIIADWCQENGHIAAAQWLRSASPYRASQTAADERE